MQALLGTTRRGWLAAVLTVSAMLVAAVPPPAGATGRPIDVVIRAETGAMETIRSQVERLGGAITLDLGIIDGFAATLPDTVIPALSSHHQVVSVTPDVPVELSSARPSLDTNPPISELTTRVLDVDALWRQGITGDGVGVALIDSGVTQVGGLDGAGKVVYGPDLSFDSGFENLRNLDMYGHGTHLAGIIAGRDPGVSNRPDQRDVRRRFAGVAPGAHLVSVKVADATGTADVSQVIAGIQWAVQHMADPEARIRVLALAFGTDGQQAYAVDPLAHAVESAWHAGLVVVVAAGNDARSAPLRNPATDPYVLSVGAVDARGTRASADDRVLSFSNCGDGTRNVDLLAPGRSVSSLRVPGSFIDTNHPEAVDGTRFFRGTGTSQATAVVAGAAALLLDARPELSPDQVKALLTGTAGDVRSRRACSGAGTVDVRAAVRARVPADAEQTWPRSDGSGSLEAARGSYHVLKDGEPLVGEIDVTGTEWSGGTWSGGTWSGGTWSGGTWSGGTWSGGTWSGGSWSGGTWSGGTWSGGTWSGGTWSGGTWSGGTWSGGTWSGGSWSGGSWSAASWG